MDQIIDITTEGRHLSKDKGFLKVSENGTEIGRTPLDQIAGVIVHAHGTTWSTSLLTELADLGVTVTLCGINHAPRSALMPIKGHHAQGARMRAQWNASMPTIKQAWKNIIISKIKMQAAAIEAIGESPASLNMMTQKVTSGDSTNMEAQAARHYWPLMMGNEFRRDVNKDGANALLNYGYTVLRATASRAVVAAGLHPTIGLHHHNRNNAFALSDDLMEPFRPLVDCTVRNIIKQNGEQVDTYAKQKLAQLIAVDLPFQDNVTPTSVALIKLASSLGQSFETKKLKLELPDPPDPMTLSGLGK